MDFLVGVGVKALYIDKSNQLFVLFLRFAKFSVKLIVHHPKSIESE
jgi:hypothetical protein